MWGRAPTALWLTLSALVAGAGSCTTPGTEVVFRVLSDDLVPRWCDRPGMRGTPQCPVGAYALGEVDVRVCRGECVGDAACRPGDLLCQTFLQSSTRRSARDDLPGDVTVTPQDVGQGGSVGVYVRAVAGDARLGVAEQIERRFVVPFVPERTSLVEVWLVSRCFREVCPAGTTCGRTECEAVRNPTTQPFTPTPSAGPTDAGGRELGVLPPLDAPDLIDVIAPDVIDAPDMIDVIAPDVIAPDVVDAPTVIDTPDVVDAPTVIDTPDVRDAMDVPPDCGDTVTDPMNCGACGRACRADQVCLAGACRCGALSTECSGACVNTERDVAHCGACGRACGVGAVCAMGACLGGCDAGMTSCGDAGCFDLLRDPARCGRCEVACAAGSECRGGTCSSGTVMCMAPRTQCGRGCVDTNTDHDHCGGCGRACITREVCCDGVCTTSAAPDASCGAPL